MMKMDSQDGFCRKDPRRSAGSDGIEDRNVVGVDCIGVGVIEVVSGHEIELGKPGWNWGQLG